MIDAPFQFPSFHKGQGGILLAEAGHGNLWDYLDDGRVVPPPERQGLCRRPQAHEQHANEFLQTCVAIRFDLVQDLWGLCLSEGQPPGKWMR